NTLQGESGVLVRLDDMEFKLTDDLEVHSRLLQLRNRLFAGIAFECFKIQVDDNATLDFVRKFMTNFKIENLHFVVESDVALQNSLRIMEFLPRCTYTITIVFISNSQKLNSLPPMENLELFTGCGQVRPIRSQTCSKRNHQGFK
ncbi:hypothetical protein PENTCL1PPCAC_20461, partial [Pristionchus entomophagus]